jgi:hypothetical protein
MWQREGADPSVSYLELSDEGRVVATLAENYCSEVSWGGYEDWRLPSRIELVSLIDFTRFEPAIDSSVFPDTWLPSTSSDFLSSSRGPRENQMWAIDFRLGESQVIGPRVRCVRTEAAQNAASPRYLAAGEGATQTVTDQATDLVWQRTPSDQQFTFAAAQTYCAELEIADGGFRVPSIKELATIVDESKLEEPAIDLEVFETPAIKGIFWASSRNAETPDTNAWSLSGFGEMRSTYPPLPTNVDRENYVRCVK